MKRTPLKRKTPLRVKITNWLKRRPINPVSVKQVKELALRVKLKAELLIECGGRCMSCGSIGDWRGLTLSHIIPLSRGGKTNRGNCLIECYLCHDRYEKHPERRTSSSS